MNRTRWAAIDRRTSLIVRVETGTAHHPEVVTRVAPRLALVAGDARVEMLPTSMAELVQPPARHATGAGDGAYNLARSRSRTPASNIALERRPGDLA